jgi:hypothetical protein
VTETQPGILERLLRWCTDSTRDLARKLADHGYEVSHTKVAELLAAEGYSLQANIKTLEGASHPDRDGQFRHIEEQARSFMAAGDPVVSVDTKKKENLGQYKNAGTALRPAGEPTRVKSHDFPERLPHPGVEDRSGRSRRRDGSFDHGVPLSAGDPTARAAW